MAIDEAKRGQEHEEPAKPQVTAPDIDAREEEGWSQPESSAQKMPPAEPENGGGEGG